jgi:Anti-sigma-K factor rskA
MPAPTAAVEREAALLASAGQPRTAKPRRLGRRFRLPLAAVAVLACAALLFSSGGERSVPFQSEPALRQASAQLEVEGNRATLVANHIPAPPEGKVYMVWLKRPGQDAPEPTSALFTPRSDGSATASVPGAARDDAEAVLVNTEAPPGPDAPTSPVLMSATLS